MDERTAAIKALLGKLTLCAISPAKLEDPTEKPLKQFEVSPAGTVVGRGEEADVTVVEPEGYISRQHLLVSASGVRWMAVDLSSHGTRLLTAGGEWRDLSREVPIPLAAGDRLRLAEVAWVAVNIEFADRKGRATREPRGARPDRQLLPPPLDRLAFELLRPRRESPGSAAVPSVADLAEKLDVSGRQVYTYREQLAAMGPLAARVNSDKLRWDELADAVAAIHPYLATPVLGDPGKLKDPAKS